MPLPLPCAFWPLTVDLGVDDKIDLSVPPSEVAVGTSIVAQSSDGAAWSGNTPPSGTFYAAAWNGSTFAAVGFSCVATSRWGVTWTPATIPGGFWYALASNGAIFVAVGNSGAGNVAVTSPDGVTWTSRTIPTGTYFAVTWTGSQFVAVGANIAATSPDGITWTSRTIPAGSYLSIAWSGSVLVALGSGLAASSPDGITWTARTVPAGTNYNAVAWNGSVFAAVGSGTLRAITSPDGITWTTRTMVAGSYNALLWSGTAFVAVGPDSAATSPDGITWTARDIPAGTYRGIARSTASATFSASVVGTFLSPAALLAAVKSALDGIEGAELGTWTVTADATGRVTLSASGARPSFLFGTGPNVAASAAAVLGFAAQDLAAAASQTGPYQHANAWYALDPVADDTGDLPEYERAQTRAMSGRAKSLHFATRYRRQIDLVTLPEWKVFKAKEGGHTNEAIEHLFDDGWSRFRWWPDASVPGTYSDYVLDLETAKVLPRKRLSPGNPLYSLSLVLRPYVT